jgi:uncharacterized protein
MNLQFSTRPKYTKIDSSSKKETARAGQNSGLPDSAGAQAYALERLAKELPSHMHYHNLYHTQSDVLPAIERLAAMEKVDGEGLILLRTAALFHDLGFVIQSVLHEDVSIQIAHEVLPKFRYTHRQIEVITSLISTTRLPQSPHSLLDEIMADADLDVLGRRDFMPRSEALRRETLALGKEMSDVEWYTNQLRFLTTHQYFTQSARSLRDARKQRNIAALEHLLRMALSS